MALSAKLELRQGQQLVMTPQLQQAIRLLQFSNMELAEYVDAELERNPLLEREDNQPQAKSNDEPSPEPQPEPSSSGGEEEWLDLRKPVEDPAGALDTDFDNLYQDSGPADTQGEGDAALSSWANVRQRMSSGFEDSSGLESVVAGEETLRDHLVAQLPLTISDPRERLIGQYLIDMVDEAGYISSGFDTLSLKLGAPVEMIEGVLQKLQTFDPVGVFARSLAECLALQLKEQNRYDPYMAALLANLDLLAARNVNGLRKAVGCDMDELTEMIQEIKRLDPKPGLRFGSVQVQTVVPDVLVRPTPDGGWHVELNSDTLPRVLMDKAYYAEVTALPMRDKEKEFISECAASATWLIKSLDQRARTILKVASEIVRQQDAFFAHGVAHLRPLNLKQVADAIEMHESTVSRVTTQKYMATPRGVFELKYFFGSHVATDTGGAASSTAIRALIRQLVDAEDSKKPLSDARIAEILGQQGIVVARRTIAKYRESLNIPPVSLRKSL
ncbi:MAG: RNA polymerase factor sigma-54 [Hyphomicrobiaceae bacterium]|nr:RNA polymerase factor sigma-54 [Hyphomicrobiaceae bacterium]